MADLKRFVTTKGNDGSGTGDAKKPYRTIQKAAADLRSHLAPGQIGKILVAPGLYEEVVVLGDNMQLLRQDSKDQVALDLDPESTSELQDPVRIKRPPAASTPDKNSGSPTWTEVVKVHGNNVLVRGVRIEGDARPQRAILVVDSRQVTIQGCVISGAQSRIVYKGKGTGTKADPFHESVLDEGEGAGMRILRSRVVAIRGCLFSDNHTELKFEQVLKDREIDKLKDSVTFKTGVAIGKIDPVDVEKKMRRAQPVRNGGGHLSCFDSEDIVVDGCFFIAGSCGGRGGAVQLAHKAYASFNRCLFAENESAIDGGGVAFSDPDPKFFSRKLVTFTDCKFRKNKSGDDGGGAYFTTAALVELRKCTFDENRATANGGGLRATFGAKVTLRDCTFTKNEGNIDAGSNLERNRDGGGAIAANNASLDISGGKLENNHANGFAGGGIYFIVAAYDANAERVAEITHGDTFEKILKQGYKFSTATLNMSNVIIAFNKADGETCFEAACTLSPRAGFKAAGAGGAIYALGASSIGIPVNVVLDDVTVMENLSAHVEDKQKSELVFRDVDKLVIKKGATVVHASNKFALSLISVADADLTASPNFLAKRAQTPTQVFEEKSSVKP